MLSQEIRKKFLKYFQSQSHRIVPSSSVVPKDDPTLLFTNAGMNQFKDIFLGTSKRDYKRATSSQKCIRVGGKHNDLENVGHTSRHLTFFEMLGNFSFGDYFKKEAIGFAWDVSTHIFSFDPDKIWASVYEEDDEAFSLWEQYLPSSRIVRFGEKENFWSMGDVGPCGPCSELLYDRGEKYSDAKSPIYDLKGERYLEFWNLVFMQFNKKENGKLLYLPKPCVDTGAGLERILSLMIKVDSVFLTDIFQNIIKSIEKISKIKYDIEDKERCSAFNVISDHIRSLCFAISDGAQPSNTERGYILRKILRRAVRYGKRLNLKKPFLKDLVPPLIESMGEDYPDLISFEDQIKEILTIEEENFQKTLKRGGNLLNDIIEKSHKKISGEDAFKLKDTYGFPLEEILLLAKDAFLDVDLKKFYELEEEAKKRSKEAYISKTQIFDKNIFADFSKTHSCNFYYDKNSLEATVIGILKDDIFVDQLNENEKGILILDKTPFYAEKGGQAGDKGDIFSNNNIFKVSDCQTPYPEIIIHKGFVKKGLIQKGKKVNAAIDIERRQKICNNHSATHLLNWALEKILGSHIVQSGSYVDDKRLRFDFSHHKSLSFEDIKKIEEIINEEIRKNIVVATEEISFEEAQKDTSIKKIFEEKYSDKVRLVKMGESKELCGGCHTKLLGNIGIFKIIEEKSIAAGKRRIEAATSKEAEKFIWEKQDFIFYLEKMLNVPKPKIIEKLESILTKSKELNVLLKKAKKESLYSLKTSLLDKKEKIGDFYLITDTISIDKKDLASFIKDLSQNKTSMVICLATYENEKVFFAITCSQDVTEKGILADFLLKEISPIIEASGGGNMNFSQGGGKKKENIKKAFEKIRSIIKSKC